jgi:hypothetical protein
MELFSGGVRGLPPPAGRAAREGRFVFERTSKTSFRVTYDSVLMALRGAWVITWSLPKDESPSKKPCVGRRSVVTNNMELEPRYGSEHAAAVAGLGQEWTCRLRGMVPLR